MSVIADKCEMKQDSEGKNTAAIVCTFCPSKILNRGTATLANQEVGFALFTFSHIFKRLYHNNVNDIFQFSLPHMRRKEEGEADEREAIFEYWLVDDVYTFENILVSKTADNVKYLACADCERGPIGWHDLATKKSYIALSRVKHA